MSRSDDLIPYLGGTTSQSSAYRQGKIISWNPDTGENQVAVAGSVLENLPFYNSTEASLMSAGDVVVLETYGASYAIKGRVFYPGTPEAVSAFQAVTGRVKAARDDSGGTRNSTSWGDLTGVGAGPSVTARIGTSGKAWVSWSCELGMVLNSGTYQIMYRNTPHVGIELSGANTQSADDLIALNFNLDFPSSGTGTASPAFWIQSAMTYVYTGLNSGMTTFTMKYKHDNLIPSSGNASNFGARSIIVFPL